MRPCAGYCRKPAYKANERARWFWTFWASSTSLLLNYRIVPRGRHARTCCGQPRLSGGRYRVATCALLRRVGRILYRATDGLQAHGMQERHQRQAQGDSAAGGVTAKINAEPRLVGFSC